MVNKGVFLEFLGDEKQGDPFSPSLFAIAEEVLNINLVLMG